MYGILEHWFAILGAVGGAAGLYAMGRHRTITERVDALEDDIKTSLRRLEDDGRRTRDLLHVIIRGHMGDHK